MGDAIWISKFLLGLSLGLLIYLMGIRAGLKARVRDDCDCGEDVPEPVAPPMSRDRRHPAIVEAERAFADHMWESPVWPEETEPPPRVSSSIILYGKRCGCWCSRHVGSFECVCFCPEHPAQTAQEA